MTIYTNYFTPPTDQSVLAKVAMQDHVSLAALKIAVEKITDQSALASIALRCWDHDTAIAAVKKLNEQSELTRVALNANKYYLRKAAAEQITDKIVSAKVINPELISNLIVENLRRETTIPFSEFKLNKPDEAGNRLYSTCKGIGIKLFISERTGRLIEKNIIITPGKEFYVEKLLLKKYLKIDPSKILVEHIDRDNIMFLSNSEGSSFNLACFSLVLPVGSELLFNGKNFVVWGNVLFKTKKTHITDEGIEFPSGSQVGLIFK